MVKNSKLPREENVIKIVYKWRDLQLSKMKITLWVKMKTVVTELCYGKITILMSFTLDGEKFNITAIAAIV